MQRRKAAAAATALHGRLRRHASNSDLHNTFGCGFAALRSSLKPLDSTRSIIGIVAGMRSVRRRKEGELASIGIATGKFPSCHSWKAGREGYINQCSM